MMMNIKYNWIVDIDGLVYNKQKERIGFFDTDGTIYTPTLTRKFGFVDINGDTYDEFNSLIGSVDGGGVIYDQIGIVVGYVESTGLVFNAKRSPIGSVRLNIHQANQKNEIKHRWRKTIFRAAAGVVILLGNK